MTIDGLRLNPLSSSVSNGLAPNASQDYSFKSRAGQGLNPANAAPAEANNGAFLGQNNQSKSTSITSSALHSMTSEKIVLNSAKTDNKLINDEEDGSKGDRATFSENSLQTSANSKQSGEIRAAKDSTEDVVTSFSSALGSSVNVVQSTGKDESGDDIKKYDFTYSRRVEGETIVNEDGTTTTSAGGQINIEASFAGDVEIVENRDGTTSVFFSDSDKTQIYAADGSMTEVDGNALESKGNRIIFNTRATSVSTYGGTSEGSPSEGDDTIISYVDNASISTGAGNDTVYMMGKNQNVSLGDGNNSVIADEILGGTISSDNGGLRIKANLLDNVQVASGHQLAYSVIDVDEVNNSNFLLRGSNELNIGKAENSKFIISSEYEIDGLTYSADNTVNGTFKNSSLDIIGSGTHPFELVNGNNTFNASFEDSSVSMGNGNNRGRLNLSNSEMTAGNGDNSFRMDVKDNSTVNMGNGNNNLTLDIADSALNLGNGDNRISTSTVKDSVFDLGDGDNVLDMEDATGNTSIAMGDGNNTITARVFAANSKLSLGDGSNRVNIQVATDNSSISMGDGGNRFSAHTLDGNAKVEAGSGNNNMQIYSMQSESELHLGTGDNSVNVAIRSDTSTFDVGNYEEKPLDPETVANFKDSKDILATYANFASGQKETPHVNFSKFTLKA